MSPEEIEALLIRQAGQIDDREQTVADLRASLARSAPTPDTSTDTDTDTYANLSGFVEGVVAPLYASHGLVGWCARWAEHHEAVVRLDATWRAWEAAQHEPQGLGRWLREVADVQLDRLRDRDRGPFRACGPDKHLVPSPLAVRATLDRAK